MHGRLKSSEEAVCRVYLRYFVAAIFLLGPGVCPGETPSTADWRISRPLPPAVTLRNRSVETEQNVRFTRFQCQTTDDFQTVEFELNQNPAMAIDEFKATVEVNSSQKGIRVAVRMVLPNQTDPRTGMPLTTLLLGEETTATANWQMLSITGERANVQSAIRQLRTEVSQTQIDASGAYFDACILLAELHRGTTFVDIGRTTYGPVVAPERLAPTASMQPAERPLGPRLRIERDHVVVDDRAVFLRIIPDHDEPPAFLRRMGVNGVWVADLNAEQRMRSLMDERLLVLATPPHPEFDPADFHQPLQGLPPLEQTFPLPAIWLFGTEITADQFPHLLAWAREVRSADRKLRRPLMADVVSAEGVASRQIGFVGISQHSLGWLRAFGDARNRSFRRQNASAQLTLPWEWVQTEAASGFANWRHRCGARPAYIEPEQIMMQLAASLSAGSRGVGFWKTRSLDSQIPTDLETAKTIELANLYLDILEPLLVEGRVHGHVPVSVTDTSAAGDRRSSVASVSAFNMGTMATGYAGLPVGPDAAIINSPGTSLVLAAFWDGESHFVPQKLFAQNARMTVSATETASAWRILATGLRGLRRQPMAGGLRLDIQEFDQLAAVLVTSDSKKRLSLESRIQSHAERAGHLFVDLAELKLARVTQICQVIDSGFAGADTTAFTILESARQTAEAARQALERNDFPSAESLSRSSMRTVRIVQGRYWDRAVQSLSTPMASPHTVCFSTLPDHWEMLKRMHSGSPSANLVPSGDFSSLRLLSDGSWKKISPQDDCFLATADIVTESLRSNQVLQLRAWRRDQEVSSDPGKPSILVRSPEIMATAGDLFEISVKAKLGQGIRAELESPLLIFDSDLGPEFAVSPKLDPGWRTYRLFRQVSQDGPFRIWIALNDAADVYVDDVSVVRRANGRPSPLPEFGKTQLSPESPENPGSRVKRAGYSNSSLP